MFVTDGAAWIGNWLSATYPDSTHILDYFHVVEKLAFVAKGLPTGKKWLTAQQSYLLDNQSEQVGKNVASLTHLPLEERDQVVGYLLHNRHRMRDAVWGLAKRGPSDWQWPHRSGSPNRFTDTNETFRATLGELEL